MIRSIVTAVAVFVSTSVNAAEIRYWNANLTFVQQIGTWYEQAPKGLKDRMYDASIFIAKDKKNLGDMLRWNNTPKSDVAKYSGPKGDFVGIAYIGVPRAQRRAIVFIEDAMLKDPIDWQRKAVYHEMMHLLDGGPSRPAAMQSYMSEGPEFRALWEKDKRDWQTFLKDLPQYKPVLAYYFNDPTEAFADIGARMLAPLPDNDDFATSNAMFKKFFARSSVYVKNTLMQYDILPRK